MTPTDAPTDASTVTDPWALAALRQVPPPVVEGRPLSGKRRFARRFRRQTPAMIALGFLLFVVFIAIFGRFISPQDPNIQDLARVLEPPSSDHWLGTDQLGRDVVSRIISGSSISLLAALEGTSIALLLGVPLGVAAGFFGRWVDRLIMMVNDALMSLPALILVIAIVTVLGPGLTNAMVAVGVVTAPRVVRLVRSAVLQVREETYVEASRSIGTPTLRILRRHVLPNSMAPLVVFTSLLAGRAMVTEAGLSFLGIGVQSPQASWGSMLGQAFRKFERAPYLILYPGLAIALTVLAFNVLGDGVRDSLGREERRA